MPRAPVIDRSENACRCCDHACALPRCRGGNHCDADDASRHAATQRPGPAAIDAPIRPRAAAREHQLDIILVDFKRGARSAPPRRIGAQHGPGDTLVGAYLERVVRRRVDDFGIPRMKGYWAAKCSAQVPLIDHRPRFAAVGAPIHPSHVAAHKEKIRIMRRDGGHEHRTTPTQTDGSETLRHNTPRRCPKAQGRDAYRKRRFINRSRGQLSRSIERLADVSPRSKKTDIRREYRVSRRWVKCVVIPGIPPDFYPTVSTACV